jgi:hypothetical protein
MTRTRSLSVFVVQHARPKPNDEEDVKFIGVYSTRENADAAIKRLKKEPGFSEYPDEFHVDKYDVDVDHWTEGFGI